MKNFLFLLGTYIFLFACSSKETSLFVYQTEILKIEQLTEAVFIHTSYLETSNYGRVACNGMIVIDDDEAMVFDTPIDNSVSKELIGWITKERGYKIKGVVVTHFHIDCLGGLEEFHMSKIPSFANQKTISLAKEENSSVPEYGFDEKLELMVGDQKVINVFFGEGHTSDNIVSYIPKEKILFGGCLIKSIGAAKGNLEDANEEEWSATVLRLKEELNEVKIVIPGHGRYGGPELLDYTIKKFQAE